MKRIGLGIKDIANIFKETLYFRYWGGVKYHNYPVASNIREMVSFANWIKIWSNLEVKNIFEIGANYGQDAETLRHCFRIKNKDVYVFEAHPQIYNAIKKLHKFNAYNYAVYNKTGTATFNICDLNSKNSGVSTLLHDYKRHNQFKQIQVKTIRMDEFMEKNNIDTISFLKLDVEGANYEVLDGFGNRLNDIGAIHIEAEHIEEYKGETLWNGIKQKLELAGFEMVYFQRFKGQSDSFWVQKEYLLNG